MPLVKAQCSNCGSILEVDEAKDAAICPCCNTPYVVEKAIKNFITNNQYTINNADIHIQEAGIEELLENADVFLNKLHKYDEAYQKYEKIVDRFPGDYRGWWGLVCACTKNLTVYSELSDAHFESAFTIASDEVKRTIKKEYNGYKKKLFAKFYAVNLRKELEQKESERNRIKNDHSYWLICICLFAIAVFFFAGAIRMLVKATTTESYIIAILMLLLYLVISVSTIIYIQRKERTKTNGIDLEIAKLKERIKELESQSKS